MTRKLAWVGFSYMCGLLLASVFGLSAAAVLLAGTAVLTFLPKKRLEKAVVTTIYVCLICMTFGVTMYKTYTEFVYKPFVSEENQFVKFSGKIISADDNTFVVKKNGVGIKFYMENLDANPGDNITLWGFPEEFENSYTFSEKDYYKSKGIFLNFRYVGNVSFTENNFSVLKIAYRYRNFVTDKIDENMSETEGAFLKAMLLGDKSGLDENTKTALNRSGIGHIMAVSGIHMTLIYMFVTNILFSLRIFNRKSVFVISMILVGFFCVMTGLSMSSLRAFIMLFICGIAGCSKYKSDTMNSLGIAGIILTGINPYAIGDTGFILSIAGVIGCSAVNDSVSETVAKEICSYYYISLKGKFFDADRVKGKISNYLSPFCAYAATFPFTVLYFDEVSVISPISNMLLVPLCTLSLLLCALSAFLGEAPFISEILLRLSEIFCKPVLYLSGVISNSPPLFIPTGSIYVKLSAVFIMGLIIGISFMLKDFFKGFICGLICSIVVIVSVNTVNFLKSDDTYVAYVNSDGYSAVIVINGLRASVFDLNSGESAAKKYLTQNGIYYTDMVYANDDTIEYISFEADSYYVPEKKTRYEYEKFCEKNTLYDYGYFSYALDENKNICIYADDKTYRILRSNDVNKSAYVTFLSGDKEYTVADSQYVISDGKGEYNTESAVYENENVCIEFKGEESKVIYYGGDYGK